MSENKKRTVTDVYKLVEDLNQALSRLYDLPEKLAVQQKNITGLSQQIEVLQGQMHTLSVKLDELQMQPLQQTEVKAKRDYRQKVPTCKYCGKEIVWPKPYTGGGPNNVDGSPHRCQSEA